MLPAVLALSLAVAAPSHDGSETSEPTVEEMRIRYPDAEANDSARTLEELAARVGIDLVPKRIEAEGRARPGGEAPEIVRSRKLRQHVHNYVKGELQRSDLTVAAPDEQVREFVVETGDGVAAIVAHLQDAETPRWERDVVAAPIPNLLGAMNLHRLLLLHAVVHVADGDTERATEPLDASLRLNQAYADRPELISQLIRLANARHQLALMRKLPLPPAWVERADIAANRQAIAAGIGNELWWMRTVAIDREYQRPKPLLADDGLYGWYEERREDLRELVLDSMPVKAYHERCFDDTSGRVREAQAHYAELDPCGLVSTSRFQELLDATPWWNKMGPIYASYYDNVAHRIGRARLEEDLTRQILELRAEHARSGRWPEAFDPIRSCRDHLWTYEVSPGGEMALALEPELPQGDGVGLQFATAFRATAP